MLKLFFTLIRRFLSACCGYFEWHRIVHKNNLRNEWAVILVPYPIDMECTEYAVKYLEQFLTTNKYTKAIFLGDQKRLNKLFEKYKIDKQKYKILQFSKTKSNCLIDFYNANLNDSRLIIASLDVPRGRNGLDYLRTNVLTKEEIFVIGIYNIMNDKN